MAMVGTVTAAMATAILGMVISDTVISVIDSPSIIAAGNGLPTARSTSATALTDLERNSLEPRPGRVSHADREMQDWQNTCPPQPSEQRRKHTHASRQLWLMGTVRNAPWSPL